MGFIWMIILGLIAFGGALAGAVYGVASLSNPWVAVGVGLLLLIAALGLLRGRPSKSSGSS